MAHADRRVAEASKFGLTPVLAPLGGERIGGARSIATLRDALRTSRIETRDAEATKAA